MSASSHSATASIIFSRYSSACSVQLGRNLDRLEARAQSSDFQRSAFISIEIDDAVESCPLLPHGIWIAIGLRAQALADLLQHVEKIRADAVHLVDEADARDVVLVGLAPDGFGLRLDAFDGARKRATAPSSTRSERSTSIVKSTWPGVSMMLMRMFVRQKQVVAAEVIVIPRSCSCGIQSMTVVPS